MNIHDLSEYQLYKLKSIDPALSPNWYESIESILPKLNKTSQYSVYKNILKPRGIVINSDKKLVYQRPETLSFTIANIRTNNKDMISVASHMIKIIDSDIKVYNALKLADKIEALLGYLDNLDMQESIIDQKSRHKIRIAFLYELAAWIDTIELTIHSGLRQLDTDIVRSYFKEVFIKQQIQGRDFRSWDSSDLNFQEFNHFPAFIKKEGLDRKFFVIEGQVYWFLIGIADQIDKNPYSFRRFLHEDKSEGEHHQFIYLTHIVLHKHSINDTEYLKHASYSMSRLYTLNRGISDTILKFVNEIKRLYNSYLKPLLKEPLEQDGSQPEAIIKERLVKYEKQLSLLILQKLPNIIKLAANDVNDQNYLFYNLDRLTKQMSENIQDFRLQPLVMYSDSGEIMLIKLITMRKILDKLRVSLHSRKQELDEHAAQIKIPLLTVKEKLEEAEISLNELQSFKSEVLNYKDVKANGSYWQKLKIGRTPKYSIDEIVETEQSIHEDFFMFIIRMAKNKSQGLVYPEFECNEIINETYRHYALADGDLGISQLPRILRLNENRSQFNTNSIKEAVYEDIFESNQEW